MIFVGDSFYKLESFRDELWRAQQQNLSLAIPTIQLEANLSSGVRTNGQSIEKQF